MQQMPLTIDGELEIKPLFFVFLIHELCKFFHLPRVRNAHDFVLFLRLLHTNCMHKQFRFLYVIQVELYQQMGVVEYANVAICNRQLLEFGGVLTQNALLGQSYIVFMFLALIAVILVKLHFQLLQMWHLRYVDSFIPTQLPMAELDCPEHSQILNEIYPAREEDLPFLLVKFDKRLIRYIDSIILPNDRHIIINPTLQPYVHLINRHIQPWVFGL